MTFTSETEQFTCRLHCTQ